MAQYIPIERDQTPWWEPPAAPAASPWRVPLFDLSFGREEVSAVTQVLRSGWLTMGRRTQELEEAFASEVGAPFALAVSNGTAALHLANLGLGLGPGDEVITTPLTFVATANSIVITGAKPVFADIIGPEDLNLDPAEVERRLTPRTKAVTVVHYGGNSCRLDEICQIAQSRGLAVIEDCAHAPGASHQGRPCGTWGLAGCFSFYSNKNLTTGEGGMVVTSDAALAQRLELLRSHGVTASVQERHQGGTALYDVAAVGCNYRIDEMRAALGLCQLSRLAERNRRRQKIGRYYRQLLAGEERLVLPFAGAVDSARHIFPVLLHRRVDRDAFREAMHARGVQTSIHYPPVHQFSWYRRHLPQAPGSLARAEDAGAREVTLPLYPEMGLNQVGLVAEAVAGALEEAWR